MKELKAYLEKNPQLNLNVESPLIQEIIQVAGGKNSGYILQFVKFHIEQNITISHLRELNNKLREYKHILKHMPKATAAYRKFTELVSDLSKAIHDQAINQIWQELTSPQKEAFDFSNLDGSQRRDAFKFSNFDKKIRKNFTKNISKHKSVYSLFNELHVFCERVENGLDLDSIVKEISQTDNAYIRQIDRENGVIVASITSEPASFKLGRGSAWCLSIYKTYFERYKKNNTVQYFVWDTNYMPGSNESMVAMTVQDTDTASCFTHAHYFGNGEVNVDSYFKNHPYIKREWFTGASHDEAKIEKFIDSGFRDQEIINQVTISDSTLLLLMQSKLSYNKIIDFINDRHTKLDNVSSKVLIYCLKKALKEMGSTRFYNRAITTLKTLNIEVLKVLIEAGLHFKYYEHLDTMVHDYLGSMPSEHVEIVNINGRRCRKITRIEPIGMVNLENILALAETNPKVISNKLMIHLSEADAPMELFQGLLKLVPKKLQNVKKYKRKYRIQVIEHNNKV